MSMRSRKPLSTLHLHVSCWSVTSSDAAHYGIETLAPRLFHGAQPDLVVSGPNIGSKFNFVIRLRSRLPTIVHVANTGLINQISGTMYVSLRGMICARCDSSNVLTAAQPPKQQRSASHLLHSAAPAARMSPTPRSPARRTPPRHSLHTFMPHSPHSSFTRS